MIRIAIVDDHMLLRKSLAGLLQGCPDICITLEAGNGAELIEALRKSSEWPDIVLMDITMPVMNGTEATRWLRDFYPDIKVLALSMFSSPHMILRMLRSGARGYISKDCEASTLRVAIRTVHEMGYYFNEYISFELYRHNGRVIIPENVFTVGELQFLKMACTDRTYDQIAAELGLSPRTVEGYRDKVIRKLNVRSRVGIALFAIRNGLVDV